MQNEQLNELAQQMVSNLKSMDDFKAMHKLMLQQFINNSLEAEMQEYLGYAKHEKSDQPNKRNGKMSKTVGTELGDIQIDTPRDRDSSFEPQLVKKQQTRITGIDEQILYFYAKGQSTSEISDTIRDIYGVEVSDSVISRVTDAILPDIIAWQNRPLDVVYPIVYLDCIVVKIRQDNRIINKAIYTTNVIESLNSVVRSAVNKRKVFPSNDSAKKVVYLAVQNASKKWTMPIRDWTSALNRFTIEFADRIESYL